MSLNDVGTFGFHNQEISDLSFADGNPPPQGSVFDTFNYGHGFENVYSDLAGTGANGTNTITDTFVTPFGSFNIPTTFDVMDALPAADFTYQTSQVATDVDLGCLPQADSASSSTCADAVAARFPLTEIQINVASAATM
ncbi:MAG: hypothetical protein WA317_16320 [Mycobacterium sp.]|uniref:hypothetical protein n=1 Tax=Mycobacterium sp. TaxID=1785 RepID=UPI003CC6A92C